MDLDFEVVSGLGCSLANGTMPGTDAAAGSPSSPQPVAAATAASVTAEVKGMSACMAKGCVDVRKGSFSWCSKHKRSYDCVYGQYNGKNASSEGKELFISIFGSRGKGMDEDAAGEVIASFERDHPDGSVRPGQARGKCDLSQYRHREGTREELQDMDDSRVRIDKEAFICAMKNQRSWSQAKAEGEWSTLREDPDCNADNKGLYGSERIKVPSVYFGGLGLDRVQLVKASYQEKSLETMTKASRMSQQERDGYRAELNMGFKRMSAGASASGSGLNRLHEALPVGAATALPGSAQDLAAAISGLLQKAVAKEPQHFAGNIGAMDVAEAAAAVNTVAPPMPSIASAQVATIRNKMHSKSHKELQSFVAKLIKDVKDAQEQAEKGSVADGDGPFMGTLKERIHFMSTFSGITLVKTVKGQAAAAADGATAEIYTVVPMDFLRMAADRHAKATSDEDKQFWALDMSGAKDDAEKARLQNEFKAKIHAQVFSEVTQALEDPPCEEPEKMISETAINSLVKDFLTVKTVERLEAGTEAFDFQMKLLKQVKHGLVTGTRDLRKNVNDRAKTAQKQVLELKAAEDESKKKASADEAANEKKRMAKMKGVAVIERPQLESALASSPSPSSSSSSSLPSSSWRLLVCLLVSCFGCLFGSLVPKSKIQKSRNPRYKHKNITFQKTPTVETETKQQYQTNNQSQKQTSKQGK